LNRVLEADAAVEVDTVHKYQGREKDVVILSTVANQVAVNDFVDQASLINVAVSRAVKKLIVIVSEGAEEWHGTNLGDLVRYMQYHNFEVIESRVYSVFDLLYSSFSQELLLLMQDTKYVSAFQSENLANNLIERVLSEPAFSHLERVLHQPLKMLIRNPDRLTAEECKFAMNSLTHTYFVIFNKLDKMPVLVIEVDGYAYHQRNPEQLRRDRMKDEILRKYEIPMLRLSTVESGEEERIRRALI
jgi:very-short-patch-repair endonuclease